MGWGEHRYPFASLCAKCMYYRFLRGAHLPFSHPPQRIWIYAVAAHTNTQYTLHYDIIDTVAVYMHRLINDIYTLRGIYSTLLMALLYIPEETNSILIGMKLLYFGYIQQM